MSVALLLMVAPAPAPGPAASAPPAAAAAAAAPPADANLYVYRDHAEPLIFTPSVKVDGRKVAGLAQKQFTALHVAPGNHLIEVDWPFLSRQGSVEAYFTIVDSGPPHYFEIMGTSRTGVMMRLEMRSELAERPADTGAERLRACCHFKPAK
ncbi:MAG: DUF2846 domain-containing protein [Alphaproteobacteria bacterium]|nr:DUF2846 domain-containing protein [Alphaproteobacteria bacterium]